MIKLDENKNFKQVRFSPRLDFVPLMNKKKLEIFYNARNKISQLYNSKIPKHLLTNTILYMLEVHL